MWHMNISGGWCFYLPCVGSLMVLVHVVLSLAFFPEVRLLGGVRVDEVEKEYSLYTTQIIIFDPVNCHKQEDC
jgi:hypothetical protein